MVDSPLPTGRLSPRRRRLWELQLALAPGRQNFCDLYAVSRCVNAVAAGAAFVIGLAACEGGAGPPAPPPNVAPAQPSPAPPRDGAARDRERCGDVRRGAGVEGAETITVELWYAMPLDDALGAGLVAVQRQVPATRTVATAALNAWIEGPTCAERREGIVGWIPDGTRLRGVSISNGTAIVDLSRHFERSRLGTVYEGLLLEQLAWTITQFSTVDRALLKIEGRFKDSYMGHGLVVDEEHPLTRG